jgi:hypothetical protein
MAYSDFTLELLRERFGVESVIDTLFPPTLMLPAPDFLRERLMEASHAQLNNEKSRSEWLIHPILAALWRLNDYRFTLFSGETLRGDPAQQLIGECDFLLVKPKQVPIIRAPVVCITEAKKQDIEQGVGQCAAQMLGAQRFNLRDGAESKLIYGCVTTGDVWQFLKFQDNTVFIHHERYYLNQIEIILGIFQSIIDEMIPATTISSSVGQVIE